MRKLVVLICVFLIISGLLLSFPEWNLWLEYQELLVLFHIWLGFFFMVVFPMYAWDHIRTHQQRLKTISLISLTGGVQFLTGIGLIFSGLILMLYGSLQLYNTGSIILLSVFSPCFINHALVTLILNSIGSWQPHAAPRRGRFVFKKRYFLTLFFDYGRQ